MLIFDCDDLQWFILAKHTNDTVLYVNHIWQGRSQNYIKGGSKFGRPLLSRHRFTDKTLGHQRKRTPSSTRLFTLYCKNKIIR